MDATDIKPALTPEEWENHRRGNETGRRSVDMVGACGAWLRAEERVAVIAIQNDLLPDDDLRKITREHVAQLLAAAKDNPDEHRKPLRAIAAKLAALLPPE